MSSLRFKEKPKKVGLFLGTNANAGGMFQYAQTILEALSYLDNQMIRLEVVYTHKDWEKVLKHLNIEGSYLKRGVLGQLIANIFMILCIPPGFSRKVGKYLNPLIGELKGFKCDIWFFPAQDPISYQLAEPFIGTIHDLMHRYQSHFPEVKSFFRYHIREHRFKNIVKFSSVLLVDSLVGKQHVIESYQTTGEKIYPLPYIAPAYIYNEPERANFDSRYKLPKKFFFYPAQFWMHKNHIRLINSIRNLTRQFPDIALVLSGSKRHNFKIVQKYVIDHGLENNILFVGYIPDEDISGVYKRARALVMPTFFGPTNIPPLEAMASGCPAVLSDIFGMKEQSGEAALYFDPLSEKDMAEKIKKVWIDDSLIENLKKAGLKRDKNNRIQAFTNRLKNVLELV